MRDISFKNALIILIILSSGFILFFYSSIVFHPNQYLFSATGDGISSYYNSLYHIEHDSSYLNFQGMNYPYGEHITYSVNNPLFTNTIKFLSGVFPGLSNYAVGIFNFSMIFSFLLTAFFLFLIFNQLKISRIISIISSIAIMALSPQIFRMQGHLSLAYGFFIPFSFWLLLQGFYKENKLIWLVLLFFNSIFWIMVHPYYTGILAAFLLSFALFQLFIKSETIPNRFYFSIALILVAILPIVIYKVFLIYTDSHLCRTTKPWGFLIFTAEPECVFLPHHPPLRDLFYSIFRIKDQNWEGLAYIGMANNIVIITVLWMIFKRKLKDKKKIGEASMFQNRFLKISVLSSIIVLLFSMGLPFAIYPKYVPEFFNFLNEFRTPGRFAWMFFYIISIFCVWIVDQWFQQSSDSKISIKKYILLALFFIFPFIEAIPVHFDVSRSISQTPNYLSPQNSNFKISESLRKLNPDDFQAILPLPFYHRGSENFTKSPTDKILLISELFSIKSGLPILSSYLARTSIGESKKLLQVIGPAEYPKPLKGELKSTRAFLILYSKEDISHNEKEILNRAMKISENDEFMLYSIEFDSLFKQRNRKKLIESTYFAMDDFEDSPNHIRYNGIGAFSGKLSDYNTIYRFNTDSIKAGTTYEISFWMHNCGANGGQDQVNCIVYLHNESFSGETEWISVVNPAYSEVIDDCWSKVVLKYTLEAGKDKPAKLNLKMKGADRLKQIFAIDEFRVRVLQDSNQD